MMIKITMTDLEDNDDEEVFADVDIFISRSSL